MGETIRVRVDEARERLPELFKTAMQGDTVLIEMEDEDGTHIVVQRHTHRCTNGAYYPTSAPPTAIRER